MTHVDLELKVKHVRFLRRARQKNKFRLSYWGLTCSVFHHDARACHVAGHKNKKAIEVFAEH